MEMVVGLNSEFLSKEDWSVYKGDRLNVMVAKDNESICVVDNLLNYAVTINSPETTSCLAIGETALVANKYGWYYYDPYMKKMMIVNNDSQAPLVKCQQRNGNIMFLALGDDYVMNPISEGLPSENEINNGVKIVLFGGKAWTLRQLFSK